MWTAGDYRLTLLTDNCFRFSIVGMRRLLISTVNSKRLDKIATIEDAVSSIVRQKLRG